MGRIGSCTVALELDTVDRRTTFEKRSPRDCKLLIVLAQLTLPCRRLLTSPSCYTVTFSVLSFDGRLAVDADYFIS